MRLVPLRNALDDGDEETMQQLEGNHSRSNHDHCRHNPDRQLNHPGSVVPCQRKGKLSKQGRRALFGLRDGYRRSAFHDKGEDLKHWHFFGAFAGSSARVRKYDGHGLELNSAKRQPGRM